MNLGTLILLLNLLPTVLGGIPGLAPKIKTIVLDITGALSALFAAGVVSGPSVTTALAAWSGIIQVLKKDPALPAEMLNLLGMIETWIAAALPVDDAAAKLVDWNSIKAVGNV